METDEKQYERIAQWLDGEDVSLTDAERRIAEDIRQDEASFSAVADPPAVPAPNRVRRMMTAELARPWRSIKWVSGIAAAAAAIVLVAVTIWSVPWGGPGNKPINGREIAPGSAPLGIEQVAQAMAEAAEAADADVANVLADELDAIEADLLVMLDRGAADLRIDQLESELENVVTEDASQGLFDANGQAL